MLSFLGTGNRAKRLVSILCVAACVAVCATLLLDWPGKPIVQPPGDAAETPAAGPQGQPLPAQNAGLDDPTPAVPVGVAPSIATARVNSNGEAVLAGRADPGAEVSLTDGEAPIGSVTADQLGEWVLLPTDPLALGTHLLSARARRGDQAARVAELDVALAIFAEPATPEDPSPGARVQAIALAVPHAAFGPSIMLQSPERSGSSDVGDLAIALIDYTQSGLIALAGRARPGAQVRLTVGTKLIGATDASASGAWRLEAQSRGSSARQTIHIEQLDETGSVTASLDSAFDQSAGLSDAALGQGLAVAAVSEGWRVARRIGRATQYTLILLGKPTSSATQP
jgi:hypothetical protein